MTTCRIKGCERKHKARGLCHPHYTEYLRNRDRLHYRELSRMHNRRRRGSRAMLARCEECGGVFALRKDGSFWGPHKAADGSVCRGCDLPILTLVAS